ncbi:MAG TPA: hypothetical protein DCM87_06015 [Planctomycetes bacterium]|nr:hypothetical protein [Planctomycetota bacterium]
MCSTDSERYLEAYLESRSGADLARLVEAHRQMVLGVAYHYLADAAAAEDVTQDLFLSIIQRPPRPRTIRSERAFLVLRTMQLAANRRRGEARRRAREMRAARSDALASQAETTAELAEIRDAIAALPGALRLPLYLHFFEGFRIDDLAEAIGCHRNSVAHRIERGKHLLKARLSGAALALLMSAAVAPLHAAPAIVPSPELTAALDRLVADAGALAAPAPAAAPFPLAAVAWILGGVAALACGGVLVHTIVSRERAAPVSREPLVAESALVTIEMQHGNAESATAAHDSGAGSAVLPIRRGDGIPRIRIPGVKTSSPGGTWALWLTYLNRVAWELYPGQVKELVGRNWETNIPVLHRTSDDTMFIVMPEKLSMVFAPNPEEGTWDYVCPVCGKARYIRPYRDGDLDLLAYEAPEGPTWLFHASAPLAGSLHKIVGAKGHEWRFFYHAPGDGARANKLKAIYIPGAGFFWQFYYDRLNGFLEEVRVVRGARVQAAMIFDYYRTTVEGAGGPEDLKSVVVRELLPDGVEWEEHATWLRYYTRADDKGRPHDLKFLIGTANVAKLIAAYEIDDVAALTDAQLCGDDGSPAFCDYYLEYVVAPGDAHGDGRARFEIVTAARSEYAFGTPPEPGIYEFRYAVFDPRRLPSDEAPYLTVRKTGADGALAEFDVSRTWRIIPRRGETPQE